MLEQIKKIGNETFGFSKLRKVRVTKSVLFGFWIILLLISSAEKSQADPPKFDPWYFVHDSKYKFIVPDKFQHFYGSAILTEVIGPMPALAFGIIKEVHDDREAKVGFSIKDIAADALGIMSAKFARSESVKLWLDWDPAEETLVVNFGIRI